MATTDGELAPKSTGPYIVAAYIPCASCKYPCVVIEHFDHQPTHDELDHHTFSTTCENCTTLQTRVGREAFRRTVIEWDLEAREPGGNLRSGTES